MFGHVIDDLQHLRSESGRPTAPVNLIGDFAGGSLICVLGIAFAIIERNTSVTARALQHPQ